MSATTLLLCAVLASPSLPESSADALTARDLAPFARLDSSVRALPLPASRTVAKIAASLAGVAVSPLEKARAAYIWTVAHVAYAADRSRDVAATLADLKGDCDSHALLYTKLCAELGVECVKVDGEARFVAQPQSEFRSVSRTLGPNQWLVAHAWNAVRVGGKWGLVDTTYGAKATPDASVDDYFLPDPAVLATDRLPKENKWSLLRSPLASDALPNLPLARPLAWREGVSLNDLTAAPTVQGKLVAFHPTLSWKAGLRAAIQAGAGNVPDKAIFQPRSNGCELLVVPNGPGTVAWIGVDDGTGWKPLVGYPVPGSADSVKLPALMSRFYTTGASLLAPFDGALGAGKSAEIRLRAPGAAQVVAFQDSGLLGKFSREGDDWVLRASPGTGTLDVMASYEDPRKFQGLLRFEVR